MCRRLIDQRAFTSALINLEQSAFRPAHRAIGRPGQFRVGGNHVDHHPCDDQAGSSSISNSTLQTHSWVEIRQPFGNRSKESLSDLAFDKTVNVESSKRDRYGRQIGKVNGKDVNLMQVERGMAWFYRQYQREQSPNDRRLYEAAEDAAKADKRGLWRDADPVPPWEFRHKLGRSPGCSKTHKTQRKRLPASPARMPG